MGEIPHSLLIVGILWALFAQDLLAVVGIKLPGLYFRNQRVEAGYRKELVFGEEDPSRSAADRSPSSFHCPTQLFPLLSLHVLQHRSHILSPGRQYLSLILLTPTIVAGQNHAGDDEATRMLSTRCEVRFSICQFVDDDVELCRSTSALAALMRSFAANPCLISIGSI